MNNFEVIPLFAIPLYRTTLSDLETAAHSYIENLEYERMPDENGDYSVNKYILEVPELADLKSRIVEKVNHFLYEFLDCKSELDFKIENSWVNRHQPNDFACSHWHSNSLLSGVYYIDTDYNTGDIVFHRDRLHVNLFNDTVSVEFNYTNTLDQSKMNVYNTNNFGLQPQKNDLVLFPSHLSHSVDTNQSNKLRYCIAFNVFPRGTFGGKISTLRV